MKITAKIRGKDGKPENAKIREGEARFVSQCGVKPGGLL
jgi:hypothetical protein